MLGIFVSILWSNNYDANSNMWVFPLHTPTTIAAAAKSLQSCPTVWPHGRQPTGFTPVPGILQATTLEWVAISFSNACKWKVKVKSLSCVRLLVTPWTAAYQAPPSMGFSRQEYWSGLPTAILKYQLGVLQFNPVMTPPIQRQHQIPKVKGLLPGEWPPLQRPNTRSGCHVILTHCKSEFPKVSFLLFSCSVVSDSLWPHGLQHARLPCPSPSPGACSNSHPLSQWCHSTILSSVVPFSSCLQSFPASGSFLMNWLFVSGGQSIGASASA